MTERIGAPAPPKTFLESVGGGHDVVYVIVAPDGQREDGIGSLEGGAIKRLQVPAPRFIGGLDEVDT